MTSAPLQWKVTSKGEKTTIIIIKEHEQLGRLMFYMTEKILMDGIELVQEHPVTIVYNRDTMELSIKYRMQRLNKHGNFQFA